MPAIATAVPREIDEGRQEAGQRLARARWRDEERVLLASRGGEQIELMLAGRPTASCKPILESLRQQRQGCLGRHGTAGGSGGHGSSVGTTRPVNQIMRDNRPVKPMGGLASRRIASGAARRIVPSCPNPWRRPRRGEATRCLGAENLL